MVDLSKLFHYDSLSLLKEKLFEHVLDTHHVIGRKKAINIEGNKHYGYFIEKGQNTYFIDDVSDETKTVVDLFPIVVNNMVETDYNKAVFFHIKDYDSVKIPIAKKLTFKQIIDTMNCFKHTNPKHWLLAKIIITTAWIDRINYRIIATRGFGKDSIIEGISELMGNVSNIYGATFAKLEYSVKNKSLVFNEMGNLKADDKKNMQEFLLAIGGFGNKYIKRTRAGDGTQEEYDISKQSLGVIYNPPHYYTEKGQEFFDNMFTPAVPDRFMPFYMEGKLDERFGVEFDINKVVTEGMSTYKDIISSLMWFRKYKARNKYLIPDDLSFSEKRRRFERSFIRICIYISEYAEDNEELYYELIYELYNSYTKYDKVLKDALMLVK